MKLVCCCLSQVFFIKKLVSPDHHVEGQQHRSGLPTQHPHTPTDPPTQHTHTHPLTHPPNTPTHTHRPTHPTHPHTPTKEKRKGEKGKEEKRRGPAPHHTPHHKTSTRNPSSYHAPHRHHTQREREKGKGKRGPFVCGVDTMCGMNVGCKRMRCDAGVMWCSGGEKKSERGEGVRGERGERGEGKVEIGEKLTILHEKKMEK